MKRVIKAGTSTKEDDYFDGLERGGNQVQRTSLRRNSENGFRLLADDIRC